jgi:hypothetical protein
MTTSASTNFELNRDQIIKGALRILGVLAQGETPTTDQVNEAAEALNLLVKAWMADGMPLWAIRKLDFPLTATATYTIGVGMTINTPKPLRIIQVFNRNINGIDIPMRIITKDEYWRLGNKSSTGNPIQLMYDPGIHSGTIYLFPVPDTTSIANNHIHIIYQRLYEDFDSSVDTPDFPQEWLDALKFGLASRLAPEYGVPATERNLINQDMMRIKQEALNFGTEEGSLFLSVDNRKW